MAKLQKLFEAISIGEMELRNRIVMAAISTRLGTEFGAVSDRIIDYYVERAKGGVGLIVIENTCIDWPTGKAGPNPIRADSDKFILGLHDLAEAVHRYGTKIATQLQHTGRQTTLVNTEGQQPVAPSEVPWLKGGAWPRALTIEEIGDIIERFAEGAKRTQRAGFDAVELHAAHGYLITQFMSPYTNKRTDKYGGSFEARMRFPLEIIERIREKVGDVFPIIFRYSADEYIEGGLTLEDCKIIACKLEKTGVSALSITSGIYESRYRIFPTMALPRGCNAHLSEEIKKVVDIPVIVAGRINDPMLAEQIIREGKADLVAMGRPLITDPELPKKALEGRLDDIRMCIACNEGCVGNFPRGWRLSCALNPAVGREKEYRLKPAKEAKKVIVVGGGPAGMEAARVTALRGHTVTLHEKNNELGGQLLVASIAPFKAEIKELIRYLVAQVKKAGVKVELGKEVTPDLIKKSDTQVLIVATGAIPFIPEIPGVRNENVVMASDVLRGVREVGEQIVVVGGGQVGCEIAEFLARQGKKVTIVEMLDDIGMNINEISREDIKRRLEEYDVNMVTGSRVTEIKDNSAIVLDKNWKARAIGADSIVVAVGSRPDKGLVDNAARSVSETYFIGDCVKPRKIMDAIHEASYIGRQI